MARAQGVKAISDFLEPRTARPALSRLPSRRHLPSLGAFATFEVASKHLSFTLAASELNVTQAAVSQQIRSLEKALNCQLFLRMHNSMELTREGQMLLEAVTQGLDRLSDAIFCIAQNNSSRTITIAGTYAGVTTFMRPITRTFSRLNPGLHVTLLASDENYRLQDFEEVDLAVICGNDRAGIGPHLVPLFPEIVEPVCSPAYLDEHGPFTSPEDLARADLLELHRMHWSSEAISWYPLTWRDWFRRHAPAVEQVLPFNLSNSYGLLLEAAKDGDGVILGWRHLVHDALSRGHLVRMFDLPLNANRTYYLKINPRAAENESVRAFVAYFLEAIQGMNLIP